MSALDFFRKRQRTAGGNGVVFKEEIEWPSSTFYYGGSPSPLSECQLPSEITKAPLNGHLAQLFVPRSCEPLENRRQSQDAQIEPDSMGRTEAATVAILAGQIMAAIADELAMDSIVDDERTFSHHLLIAPSGTGKTTLIKQAAKSKKFQTYEIHPEDFFYNRQAFSNALSVILEGRTRGTFFDGTDQLHQSQNLCVLLVDAIEVVLDTGDDLFWQSLSDLLGRVDVPVVITSNVPLLSLERKLALPPKLVVHEVPPAASSGRVSAIDGFIAKRKSILAPIYQSYGVAKWIDVLGCFLAEWDHSRVCAARVASKRRTAGRDCRSYPSVLGVKPLYRDQLIEFFTGQLSDWTDRDVGQWEKYNKNDCFIL